MAVEYCHYCDQYIDLDYCVEHFPEQYWEAEPGNGKCQEQLDNEHEELFKKDPDNWNKQAHWGDYINKHKKEHRGLGVAVDPETGRDRG